MVHGATQKRSDVGRTLTTAEFGADAADGAAATTPVSTGPARP
jgi:hypothetical protein